MLLNLFIFPHLVVLIRAIFLSFWVRSVDDLQLQCSLICFVSKSSFKLVLMLCKFSHTFAVSFNQHVELIFCKNAELAITTTNSLIKLFWEEFITEHCQKWFTSLVYCFELSSPDLLVNQHLKIILNISVPPQVLYILKPLLFNLPHWLPHPFKPRLSPVSFLFIRVIIWISFLGNQTLVLEVFIQKFPTRFLVEGCVQNASFSNGLWKKLNNTLWLAIRNLVGSHSAAFFFYKSKYDVLFVQVISKIARFEAQLR